MRKGILGIKVGMTQVFATDGKLVPVTVISVEPNVVSQIKTVETDGYNAIQLAAINKKVKNATKAEIGHLKKANSEPKRFLKEIRNVDVSAYTLGQELKADLFSAGELVDVSGISKGKGYQGVIKRHGQSRGPMGHGSQYHRSLGSLGTMRPMRVLKGKKMAGQMGGDLVTVQNLEIVSIDLENNVILVKGNVPGPKKSLVIIKSAIRNEGKINEPIEVVSYVTEEESKEVVSEAPVEEVDTEETTVEESNETTDDSSQEGTEPEENTAVED